VFFALKLSAHERFSFDPFLKPFKAGVLWMKNNFLEYL